MEKIRLNHSKGYYDISFCGSIAEQLPDIFVKKSKYFVITDDIVYKLHGEKFIVTLKNKGYDVYSHVIKSGEKEKNLRTVENIYASLAQAEITRGDFIIALGGGVVGDISGFAAATYLRGIKFIQIPTTLLAQIDSSVGGKTGVDLPQGKNLVGAFHQPSAVLIDSDFLKTLPSDIYRDGFGEVIKCACIFDAEFFERLEKQDIPIDETIYKCVKFKSDVVEQDEFEKGLRALLNFGHTVGHAIEKYHNFEKVSHGCAVAIGMVYAAKISCIMGLCDISPAKKIADILRQYRFPVSVDIQDDKIAQYCLADKKRTSDGINFILLKEIGKPKQVNIDTNDLPKILEECEKIQI